MPNISIAPEMKAKMLDLFTMTPEELESAINCRADQFTYDTAFDMLEAIADNITPSPESTTLDRLALAIRYAFLAGFRDAAILFNDSAIMCVQEFFKGDN